MATSNSFFAFGPCQSFVAALPGLSACSDNFSTDLGKVIDPNNSKSLSFVAFVGHETGGAVCQAYVGYHKKHSLMGAGRLHCPPHDAFALPALEKWIKKQDDETEGMHVVCNAKGGYWARSSKGITTGESLSPDAWQWVKKGNPHGAEVMVALGINDSYIVSYEDGHVVWDLKGAYNELDEKLKQVLGQSTGLLYASLNPYHADEYFCIFKDSSCEFKFPTTDIFRDFEKKLLFECKLRVILDSPTLMSSTDAAPPEPLEKGKNGLNLGRIATDVVKDTLETAAKKEMNQSFADMGDFINDNM